MGIKKQFFLYPIGLHHKGRGRLQIGARKTTKKIHHRERKRPHTEGKKLPYIGKALPCNGRITANWSSWAQGSQ